MGMITVRSDNDRSLSLTHTTSQLFQLTVLLASAIASAPKKKLWVVVQINQVPTNKAWDLCGIQGTG